MDIVQQFMNAIEQGDTEEIAKLMESFLLNADPETQYEIAETLKHFGFAEEANKIFSHLIYLFPDETQLIIDRAQVLLEIGKEDEALLILSDISKLDEAYPVALLTLADYYQMIGLNETAEHKINEALTLLPNEPILLFAKAELLLNGGRYLEAARIYEDLKKQHVEIAGVSLSERLAEVYSAGAAFEEAIPYYEEALNKQVTPELLFGIGYAAFQIGHYKTAITRLEELLSLDPDYFSGYMLLSQAYGMLENNTKAYTVIKDGISRDAFEKEYYLFAGKTALKLGLEVEAEDHLRQAIALDPEYMDALLTLISLLSAEERDEEVIELIEQLTKEGLDWPSLYPFAAESYHRLEQFSRAYEFYTLAYTDHKDDPNFLEKYVFFLIEEGKREEAIEILKQLSSIAPTDSRWVELIESFN